MSDKNKFIFITGGSRSGKSSHALKLAESIGERRLYLATAQALDDEMEERIARHKKERSDGWDTAEEALEIAEVIKKAGNYDVILLDCLTLWLCNIMHHVEELDTPSPSKREGQGGGESPKDEKFHKNIDQLVEACKVCKANLIVISNETGSGIIPGDPLSRRFSDLAGIMNQKMAAAANQVIITVAGIPMTIKG